MKPIKEMTESEILALKEYVRLDFYNNELKKEDVSASMLIDDDGDGGYELVVKEGDRKTAISCGLSEDELADEVIHVSYELMRKRYVVTYVGLSDSDPDGNGHCEVKICSDRIVANRVVAQWISDELAAHDNAYHVYGDNPDTSYVIWAGGTERVIIRIHEERVIWV